MDELLQQVAELRGMPASLVERSAKAKAEKTGTTLEAVLRDWAGEGSTSEPGVAQPKIDTPPAQETAETETPTSAPVVVSTDYLVQLASEAKRMPPRLILTSAQARSDHSGISLHAVLAGWAGVDLDELEADAAEPTPAEASTEIEKAPATQAESTAPAAPVAAAAVTALTMDQLLEKVAEAKGMPASLAKRSAEARAKKTGEPLETVLQEWAGIEPGTVVTQASPAEPEAPVEPAPAQREPTPATGEETEGDDVEIIDAEPPDTSDVADNDDEPTPKRGGYPIWLAAAFVLIPLLAVAYILVSPNGPDCGSGGLLGVDAVTGEATNCDGSEYGVVTVDDFAAGGALYQQCVACHSDDGSGGVGPAFTAGAVLVTFPGGSCSDHIAWVSAGTTGWPESTYGATDKPVGGGGVMPGFGTSLTEEQLAQVALYERVAFGGEDLAEAEIDCGLVDAEDTTVEAADS